MFGPDIYTEPESDPDTLANLGPLRPMAGVWEGVKGSDQHPVADGTEQNTFIEHYELHPIDAQTNGPQLFYGLRYHTHITKPAESETFHDQVGYWLWEPATRSVTLTLGIRGPRFCWPRAPPNRMPWTSSLTATEGSEVQGIVSTPFLHQAFRTLSYRMHVTIGDDGTWSYEEEGVLQIPDRDEPFSHIDRNTLTRIRTAPAQSSGPGRPPGRDRNRLRGQPRHRLLPRSDPGRLTEIVACPAWADPPLGRSWLKVGEDLG